MVSQTISFFYGLLFAICRYIVIEADGSEYARLMQELHVEPLPDSVSAPEVRRNDESR